MPCNDQKYAQNELPTQKIHIKSEMHAMTLGFFIQVPYAMNVQYAKDQVQNDANAM